MFICDPPQRHLIKSNIHSLLRTFSKCEKSPWTWSQISVQNMNQHLAHYEPLWAFIPTKICGKIKRIRRRQRQPHSNTLAWKIPWAEEPGRLQSMGSLGVRHDWATSLSLFTFMHWRRKWQPTPVFLPGESQGQGSLVGCRPWGHTELDTTEAP